MSADPAPAESAAALGRAQMRRHAVARDLLLPEELRLGERLRAEAGVMLRATVDAVEAEVRRAAAREFASDAKTAEQLLVPPGGAYDKLHRAGLLDPDLIDEVVAQARSAHLASRLGSAVEGEGGAALLIRLADASDARLAGDATAMIAATARARSLLPEAELPERSARPLTWHVAAAVRRSEEPSSGLDRALAAAAQAVLRTRAEANSVRAAAVDLTAAIAPLPEAVGPLLLEALRERSVPLFAALLARGASLDYEGARGLLLEPVGGHFWAALKAAGVSRADTAAIAAALAAADQRLDLSALADAVDWADALTPAAAEASLGPLRLPREMRDAMVALDGPVRP